MEINEIIYTTAEADYDYWYVRVEAIVGKASNGKVIRRVRIPSKYVEYQCGRYHSGMHMVVDQAEFDKLVAYKLVSLPEERAPQPETD